MFFSSALYPLYAMHCNAIPGVLCNTEYWEPSLSSIVMDFNLFSLLWISLCIRRTHTDPYTCSYVELKLLWILSPAKKWILLLWVFFFCCCVVLSFQQTRCWLHWFFLLTFIQHSMSVCNVRLSVYLLGVSLCYISHTFCIATCNAPTW